MSKSRDIADSAATINYIDNVTSDVQSQINTLDTALDNISVTSGTLTKTFAQDESASINLTSSVLAPVVSVTKEVPQSGVTNNSWDVNSTTENYTRLDSAYPTTLDWVSVIPATPSISYTGNSYLYSGQDTNAREVQFKDDGTKMYIFGSSNGRVYQYSLSTPWDVSTASYDSVELNVFDTSGAAQSGFAISQDGLNVYISTLSNDQIRQYTLTTAWDMSTGSLTATQTLTNMASTTTGLDISADGTKIYVLDYGSANIDVFTMSTPYSIATASNTKSSYSVPQFINIRGISFSENGLVIAISESSNGITKFGSLTTAFDLSTVSWNSTELNPSSQTGGTVYAIDIRNTDKAYYVSSTNDTVYEYDGEFLATALTLGTGSFASADVGKTIEANSGAFVLTATDGSYVETTAPTSYDQVASGSWSMYGVVYNATDGDLELSGLPTYYSIAAASYIQSVLLSAQATNVQGCAFSTDGTKMYVVDYTTDTVYQYTLSNAFDVSSASYASKSFNVSSFESDPLGITFKPDGTKMFIIGPSGGSNGEVNEFALSTAWDVSTSSSIRVQSVSAQEPNPAGIQFNNDGTKMFIIGYGNNTVQEFTLPSAYIVTGASHAASFNVSAQDSSQRTIAFNNDGTKMFIGGRTNDNINQYSLSTAFSVSTASYDSISFNISSQEGGLSGCVFNADGSKMYVSGGGSDSVHEYSSSGVLGATGYHPVHTTASIDSTYWTDINSMTADQNAGDGNVYYAISTDDRTTWTVIDNTDGERDIVRNNAGTWQYNSNGTYALATWVNGTTNTELATLAEAMEGASYLANEYDITTATLGDTFSVAAQATIPSSVRFKSDGTKFYVLGSGYVNEYDLSTAWDVTTASYSQQFNIYPQEATSTSLTFSADGTKFYTSGTTNDRVNEYSMSTAWDVSTASYVDNLSVSAQETNPYGICFNDDGTKLFVAGATGQDINEYTLSTAYDVSTGSFVDSFSLASEIVSQPTDIGFSSNGTEMYVVDYGARVHQYTLSTGFDVSTSSYTGTLNLTGIEGQPRGITIKDGTQVFIIGSSEDKVMSFSLGTTSYTNQMDKTQLDAVTDPNHIALGNDLDLAIVFNMTSGSTVPSSDGVAINYDANVLNKGAVLGTDYDFDAPTQNSVRITALAANNLKVRVV